MHLFYGFLFYFPPAAKVKLLFPAEN
ncbi:hypothetical protein B14911_15192 [Bacillus sp. NRRL B-14911]|nr:hypothetical protein B14911_15192 [Bacillus sp. NRRL B-14911]